MLNIENNFRSKMKRSTCSCGQIEDMKHIYICKIYEREEENITYEKIYEDDLRKMKRLNERFHWKKDNKYSFRHLTESIF